ncbi:hypothetical protein YTPLAS18_23240 [Nitrospira sp.]|nr:hypothetical protein YTPLAS18_23240 [Nitrospira sp.]
MKPGTDRFRAHPQTALLLAVALAVAGEAFARPPAPPSNVRALDTPNDSGGTISILWDRAEDEGPELRYRVLAAEGSSLSQSSLKIIDEFPSTSHTVADVKRPWWTSPADPDTHVYYLRSGKSIEVKSGVPYTVTIASVRDGEQAVGDSKQAIAVPNWFNWNALNNLLFGIAFGVAVLLSIRRAQRGPVFLRYIPGLDAVDEAIGRSTELGKPVMYLTGAHDMSDPSTVAAAVILGRVAKRTAAYETDLMVPHRNPITMAVCQEITRQAYYEAGKPDLFREDANFFITSDQFSYTASVDGIMLRTKPAANFFMGAYFAEALLLTETGASTGAIQIAGTDSDHQLPFFVTTCDYTLIGEELYAASAYLSREPVQVGTLLGQDLGKLTVLTLIAWGSIAATVAAGFDYDWPRLFLDMIRDVK